ncbi:hypothetical protein [Prevotella pallens]|nr:hypothetical protein [Prevotella pallens]
MTINNTTTAGSPNVDFTVKSNVADQVDLMTACTGDVHYVTQGEHPTTNLNFRHALCRWTCYRIIHIMYGVAYMLLNTFSFS